MFKQKHLSFALAAAITATSAQAFDADSFTISGYVKNETAALTKDGTFVGQADKNDTTNHNSSGDVIKSESTVKLFVNGDIGESSSLHAELQLHNDSKAKGDHFSGNDEYTQSEALRELYVDTKAGDWDFRIGKQQVVWGTADGAKFMDMINPTDYREMAQNTMAESRIPVWMATAEKYLEDGGNIQILLAQPRENVFAGLNRNIDTSVRSNAAPTRTAAGIAAYTGDTVATGHDEGNPFILKGVDSITGGVNGFMNIVPDLGTVADLFAVAFSDADTGDFSFGKAVGMNASIHGAMNFFTVGGFNVSTVSMGSFSAQYAGMVDNSGSATAYALGGTASGTAASFNDLVIGKTGFFYSANALAGAGSTASGSGYTGQDALSGFAGMFATELQLTDSAVNSVFEYMDRTPFSTFDAFVGAKSQYVFDMPSNTVDFATKYKNTTSNGLNYSLGYSYAYEKNPIINLRWKNSSGETLTTTKMAYQDANSNNYTRLSLSDASGNAYGGHAAWSDGSGGYNNSADTSKYAILEMKQTVERAHNIGAGLDFGLDTESLGPVVLRGEFVYTKDAYQPVIDRGALSIGDMPAALTMRKADKFKYVIGADVTALTDMMVSAQFIQERNLDHIDNYVDHDGTTSCSSISSSNCGVYTTDYATMHLSNGFNKALENKEFYSLFLSKPFGASGEGRWNNILMLEEGGGRWNRFDVEYSLTNNLIGTAEYNKYWGDDNSQFGQLEAASNVQLGLKYLFE